MALKLPTFESTYAVVSLTKLEKVGLVGNIELLNVRKSSRCRLKYIHAYTCMYRYVDNILETQI